MNVLFLCLFCKWLIISRTFTLSISKCFSSTKKVYIPSSMIKRVCDNTTFTKSVLAVNTHLHAVRLIDNYGISAELEKKRRFISSF